MRIKSTISTLLAGVILVAYILIGLLTPILITNLIFKNAQWAAWGMIYILVFASILYGLKDYGVFCHISRWYRSNFQKKLFWE